MGDFCIFTLFIFSRFSIMSLYFLHVYKNIRSSEKNVDLNFETGTKIRASCCYTKHPYTLSYMSLYFPWYHLPCIICSWWSLLSLLQQNVDYRRAGVLPVLFTDVSPALTTALETAGPREIFDEWMKPLRGNSLYLLLCHLGCSAASVLGEP